MPSGKRSCLAAAEPILAFSLKDQECYPHRWCTAWKRILKDFQGICSEWMFWPQQVKGLVHHQQNPSSSLMNKLLRDVCEGTCPWRLWQNPPQPINHAGVWYRYSCSWRWRGDSIPVEHAKKCWAYITFLLRCSWIGLRDHKASLIKIMWSLGLCAPMYNKLALQFEN